MKTKHAVALAVIAASGMAACGPPQADSGSASVKPGDVAVKAQSVSETDAKIESSFVKTHIYMAYLKGDKIAISSKGGIVTLTGSVEDANHKPMAEGVAEALPGVTRVENRIEIAGVPAPERSDAWIRSRVLSTLALHRNVSATKTQVEVVDGVVTLKGEALNGAQKELTAEYAKDIDGVKDVKNEMTVAPEPEKPAAAAPPEKEGNAAIDYIDDVSITAQVKMALLFHRSTSALKTKVDTKDGVVTVSGNAKNPAEKDLVSKLVADVNGVKSVANNMAVAK